jgi:uncharacterized protein
MDKISVIVAYAKPSKQVEIPIKVSKQANVAMTIKASGVLTQFPELVLEDLAVGIHAKKCQLDSAVKEGDRIEIYRPLVIDPMAARRLRAKRKRAN